MSLANCPECGAAPMHLHRKGCTVPDRRRSEASDEGFLDALVGLAGLPTLAQANRVRTDLAATQLTTQLRRHAEAGCASPADLQLLAALDRWAAGELV